jgi:hypothetical protein
MLGYQVNFKTEADPDHREWHLGRWPNAEDALAFFNDNAAKKDGLGPFSFASISDFNPDYHLVGRRLPNGPEVESFFLYCFCHDEIWAPTRPISKGRGRSATFSSADAKRAEAASP